MQSALDQFRISINRVRELVGLYSSLGALSSNSLDSSDMLRAALVLAVSALDYYVHEVVTLGMLEIHQGTRAEPQPPVNATQSAFSRFQVSLGGARQERLLMMDAESWLENEIQQTEGYNFLQQAHTLSELIPVISESLTRRLNRTAWLENEIRERLGYQSFQQPDKIASAIRCISQKRLWDEVAAEMDMPVKALKQQLTLIIDRRNKIAHEADIDPSFGPGIRWAIDELLVSEAVTFVEHLVESIHQVIL